MLSGPNFDLARRVAVASGIPALALRRRASLADLETAREIPELGGVIVGRAIYEGIFTVEEALAVCGPHPPAPSPGTGEGETHGESRR